MTQMTLPDAPGLAAVIAALDGNVRLVGGAVRDTLAGLPRCQPGGRTER